MNACSEAATATLTWVHADVLGYATQRAKLPLLQDVVVRSACDTPLDGLELRAELLPGWGAAQSFPLGRLLPGEVRELGTLPFSPDLARLASTLAPERACLRLELMRGDERVASAQRDLEVLPARGWPGARVPWGVLAGFAEPGEAALGDVLGRVEGALGESVGHGARSGARIRQETAATFGVLQSFGLTLEPIGDAWLERGQTLRSWPQMLAERRGNALELALVAAAVLEARGLSPVIALTQDGVLCGVWTLPERFPEGVVEDTARLRNQWQLEQLFLFDAAGLAGAPATVFERAAERCRELLREPEAVRAALDIRVLRHAGVPPLGGDATPRAAVAPTLLMDAPLAPSAATASRSESSPTAPQPEPVDGHARFAKWKDNLLDLSLRNKLLNLRLSAKTTLPLLVPDLARFEDRLGEDRSLQLLPRPTLAPAAAGAADPVGDTAELDERRRRDLEQGVVYADLTEEELWPRAVHLERTTRQDLEEGGATTLYAGLGLLRWYEAPESREARLSPLYLLPVQLEFDRRGRRLRFRRLPEEPLVNHALIEKMRRDFALDFRALTAVPADEAGLDMTALLRAAREVIQNVPRWEILDQALLGHLTFTKFLMWNDLAENAELLLQNPVVAHIARRDGHPALRQGEPAPLRTPDDQLPATEIPCVLDADSTQLAAIEEVLQGRSLVLQGPPGTGKSQTITNLIAAALARGQSVLFVAEKMAALEVVHRRLGAAGLSDFCLELHSHKSNKKEVLESFRRALTRSPSTEEPPWQEQGAALDQLRQRLNRHVSALHAKTPLGMSYYEVAGRLAELEDTPRFDLGLRDRLELTSERWRAQRDAVQTFVQKARALGPLEQHPFKASRKSALTAEDELRLPRIVEAALVGLDDLERAGGLLLPELGLHSDGSFAQLVAAKRQAEQALAVLVSLEQCAAAGPIALAALSHPDWGAVVVQGRHYAAQRGAWIGARVGLETRWKPELFGRDWSDLAAIFARWATAFALFAWLFLLRPRQRLRPLARVALPDNRQIASDLSLLRELPLRATELTRLEPAVMGTLGDVRGMLDDPATFELLVQRSEHARQCLHHLAQVPGAHYLGVRGPDTWGPTRVRLQTKMLQLGQALEQWRAIESELGASLMLEPGTLPGAELPGGRGLTRDWVQYFRTNLPALRTMCQYNQAAEQLRQLGLAALLDPAARALPPERLPDVFDASLLTAWSAAWLDAHPELREFDAEAHAAQIEAFARLDRGHVTLGRGFVQQQLERALPREGGAIKGSELDLLLREIQKKTRHLPIRQLLSGIPELRSRLKPCFLMSPLSVAQYLPAQAAFDLVVFDEASQIETHDAIGAIGRGRQLVVVGDSKQLPPTRFFSRSEDEKERIDEDDVDDLESILDEALAKNLPQRTLGWHYRSRHDALIDFSNRHYYEERLQVFPAARRYVDDLGVTLHPVPGGVFHSGSASALGRTNPREAEALVSYLVDALARYRPEQRSFGVVTFSLSQRDLILDLLEKARVARPEIEAHFTSAEKVFVKNLENVQGDERDEILFSVAYAPDERGRLRQHFGPLSHQGGERRLNVAVTRARLKLRVFSTLSHEQIDLRKTAAVGASHLREFLRFAQRCSASDTRLLGDQLQFDTPLERELCAELTRAGYVVHTKVGAGQYRLDLAVVHPNDPRVYALGIETDGPSYASARTARDRDRLRGEVLGSLLWRTHRVWSREWQTRRAAERERLLDAARRAVAEPLREVNVPPAHGAPASEVASAQPLATRASEPTEVARERSAASPAPSPEREGDLAPVAYVRAEIAPVSDDPERLYEPASQPRAREYLERVVAVESPVHRELAYRRVMSCWGLTKLTRKAEEFFDDVLQGLVREGRALVEGDFLWRDAEQRATLSTFRVVDAQGDARELERVAPQELAAAMAGVLARALSLPEEALLRETARCFGIERLGSRSSATLEQALSWAEQAGRCRREQGRVFWVPR